MDDLEPEQLEELPEIKKTSRANAHRSYVDQANLQNDEQDGLTIYIDNLPNHPIEIFKQIKLVKQHIKNCELQWFKMEDSDGDTTDCEEMLKGPDSIDLVKGKSHITQKYCIPCTANVRTYDFDILVDAQVKYGDRKFDVISMDPPWQLSSANPTRGVAIAYDTLSDIEILDKIPYEKL